ncbi:hypothetical protein TWF718_008233 [Orbilia javanica]|uniref:Uncharacterized protein n=1 Tax=Orbilia javanica TaxID=47235 RepID=A0AAN8RH60_9PEZI
MAYSGNDSDASRRCSAGSFSEDDGFQMVPVNVDASNQTDKSTEARIAAEERIAELKRGLRDGTVTPNQQRNVVRLISDLENGVQWYLYQDGRQVTHESRNFSRVLWKEMAPDDI